MRYIYIHSCDLLRGRGGKDLVRDVVKQGSKTSRVNCVAIRVVHNLWGIGNNVTSVTEKARSNCFWRHTDPGQIFFEDIQTDRQTDRPIEWVIEATSRRLKIETPAVISWRSESIQFYFCTLFRGRGLGGGSKILKWNRPNW